MRNNRFVKYKTSLFSLLTVGILFLTGCSDYGIKSTTVIERERNCTVSVNDSIVVQCGQESFGVTNKQLSEEQTATIIGTVQKLAVMNHSGEVKDWIRLDDNMFQDMGEKSEAWTGHEGEQFVAFHHLYLLQSNEYAIDIDDEWYLVVKEDELSSNVNRLTSVMLYELYIQKHQHQQRVVLDEQNAERIVIDSQIYEVLDEKIDADCQQGQIGKINRTIVYDQSTKEEIPEQELKKLEVFPGKRSNQVRVSRTYGRVCEITGVNKRQAVAVEVDHVFYRARMVDRE